MGNMDFKSINEEQKYWAQVLKDNQYLSNIQELLKDQYNN